MRALKGACLCRQGLGVDQLDALSSATTRRHDRGGAVKPLGYGLRIQLESTRRALFMAIVWRPRYPHGC